MNMILFMCKVLHEAGTAATQVERENGGTPWSDANAARILVFYVAIPTALRTAFLHHILKMPNTPRVTTTARKHIQPQELTLWSNASLQRIRMSATIKDGQDTGTWALRHPPRTSAYCFYTPL
jgi:hypothetical protein